MLLTLPDESRASRAVATRGLSSRRAHGDLAAVGGGRDMANSAHALAGLVPSSAASSAILVASSTASSTAILVASSAAILSLHSASGLRPGASVLLAAVSVLVLHAAVVRASSRVAAILVASSSAITVVTVVASAIVSVVTATAAPDWHIAVV